MNAEIFKANLIDEAFDNSKIYLSGGICDICQHCRHNHDTSADDYAARNALEEAFNKFERFIKGDE